VIVESVEDVVYISGDLTQDHWNTIRTATALVLKRHPAGVIVDLSQVDRFTAEGAETFLHLLQYVGSGQARVILANAPEHVKQVLSKVPGVRSQLPITTSISEARESLDLLPEPEKLKVVVNPVLVALSGDPADENAIEMAVGIARQRSTSVCAAYVIEVPHALALTSPLPEREAAAKKALQRAEDTCKRLGVATRCSADRVRDAYIGLADVAEKMGAQLIFVVLRSGNGDMAEVGQKLEELFRRTTREVVVYRGLAL
jgi:anti-anti-sigma regulatory factor